MLGLNRVNRIQNIRGGYVWDDLSAQFVGQNIDVSSGRIDYDYFNAGISFAANSRYPNEPVSIAIQAKHAMLQGEGAVAKAHLHWLQEQSATPNFLLGYKLLNNGQSTIKETDWSNYTLIPVDNNFFTYTSGTMQQISQFAEIDISTLTISGSMNFVLWRDTGNDSGLFAGADPVASAVTVIYQDSHVKFNQNGSIFEFNKGI